MKPWLEMCMKPRSSIRGIVEVNPKVGFWALSSVYGIASSFFFAHFYSLGFSHSFLSIFLSMIAVGPLLGSFFILLDAWLLQKTGSLLGGSAQFSHCRAVLAWSKAPYLISLGLWLLIFSQDPNTAFLYIASETSALSVALVTFSVYIWSLFLLVQMLRDIQLFSFLRAVVNTALVSFLSFSVICTSMFSIKFIYSLFVSFF
jgi:hypothetical protein